MPPTLAKAVLLVLAVLAWGTAFVVAMVKDGWPIAVFMVAVAVGEAIVWARRA